MKPTDEIKEIYQHHHDQQRERILEAAEALFIQVGIDHVSLSAIAEAARMSRRTMYQYFPDKREIAWAIFQKRVEQWQVTLTAQPGASGLQQLEQFAAWAVNQLETSREHLRFVVEFDALYAREASAERMRQMISRGGLGGVDWVAQMVRQGMADGSLRPDLDPHRTAAALLNLLSGMNSRFALLGDRITEEYGQPVSAIYQEICRVFLRGLQSNL